MPMHTVKPGEHISRIAEEHGFADYQAIWNDPRNAALKQRRSNPHVLAAGDELYIPEKKTKDEAGATQQRHRFKCHGHQLALRLRLLDYDNQPRADTECELHVDGQVYPLRTDADGRIEQNISASAEDAWLVFRDPTDPYGPATRLKIGHLDPVEEVSGQKARLTNLGYFAQGATDREAERFAHAVQEFQCDFDLSVTGECGPETQAKLKEVHGC